MLPDDRPSLPLPEPLRGIEIGSFTHHSIVDRLPEIGRRMLAENRFLPAVVARIDDLIEEIPDGLIRPLVDVSAPDMAAWAVHVMPYLGQNWLQVPWFFAETYFYRRVLEATGYFGSGPGQGADPFAYQKRQGLQTARGAIRELSSQVHNLSGSGGQSREAFASLLAIALWGNQVDLSLWPAETDEQPSHQDDHQQREHTLVDNTQAIADYLFDLENRSVRVDFLLDNAGFELVADLFLVAHLLHSGLAATIHLHAKNHPTFVSDATIPDVQETIASLARDDRPDVASLGRQLQSYLDAGRLRLQHHPFWTSPLAMWKMPLTLRQELAQSNLFISKGDANYRRLLGDRHWPFTTPFAAIVNYMPTALVALRTLKSEVAAGLAKGKSEELFVRDPEWLVNGRWGLIQFFTDAPG